MKDSSSSWVGKEALLLKQLTYQLSQSLQLGPAFEEPVHWGQKTLVCLHLKTLDRIAGESEKFRRWTEEIFFGVGLSTFFFGRPDHSSRYPSLGCFHPEIF